MVDFLMRFHLAKLTIGDSMCISCILKIIYWSMKQKIGKLLI